MIILKRLLFVGGWSAALMALIAVDDSFVAPHVRPWIGESSSWLITIVTVLVILSTRKLRREFSLNTKWTWLAIIPLCYVLIGLAFFREVASLGPLLPLLSVSLGYLGRAINEEIFMRGFCFAKGGEATPRVTVLSTAFIFGAMHFMNLTAGEPFGKVLGTFLLATSVGLIFGLIRVITGSLFWCVVLHGAINATNPFTDNSARGYQIAGIWLTVATFILGMVLVFTHPQMRQSEAWRRRLKGAALALGGRVRLVNRRPTSVTVIAWILIVLNGLLLLVGLITMSGPGAQERIAQSSMPAPLHYAIRYLGPVIQIIAGIFMLRAANWARLLYIGGSAATLLVLLAFLPIKLNVLLSIVMYAVFVFFLLRPKASAYFARSPKPPSPA